MLCFIALSNILTELVGHNRALSIIYIVHEGIRPFASVCFREFQDLIVTVHECARPLAKVEIFRDIEIDAREVRRAWVDELEKWGNGLMGRVRQDVFPRLWGHAADVIYICIRIEDIAEVESVAWWKRFFRGHGSWRRWWFATQPCLCHSGALRNAASCAVEHALGRIWGPGARAAGSESSANAS